MNEIIKNLDKIHTTKMGVERIKCNLKLKTNDVVGYCKALIMNKDCKMERKELVLQASTYTANDSCDKLRNYYSASKGF